MTLYIGDKPVGLMKVVEKKVPKVKYGISIDNLLGNVDENGIYTAPTEGFVLDLAGVKQIPHESFYGFAAQHQGYNARKVTKLIADDVIYLGHTSFMRFAASNPNFVSVSFNSLEEVTGSNTFNEAFQYAKEATFLALKRISASYAFSNAFSGYNSNVDLSKAFPALEYISGTKAMSQIVNSTSSSRATVRLPKVQTIIGDASQYNAIFYNMYADVYLPECTHVEQYLFTSSRNSTLHFAAANQAAIEACVGYEYKFGASEIYFDL